MKGEGKKKDQELD